MQKIKCAFGFFLVLFALQASATTGKGGIIAAYTLVAPISESRSGLIARAVLPAGSACPDLKVRISSDGNNARRLATHIRPLPNNTGTAFSPVTVCEVALPKNLVHAEIGGHTIPARLSKRIQKISVFGDVGCRVTSWEVQDCNTVATWPLAKIAQGIADQKPDVILFLGDFFYREGACPANQQDFCGASPPPIVGAPFTDSAYGWMADSIMPLSPLFPTAPLVILRGNHEACDRGGNGFFLFFDPFLNSSQTCAPTLKDGQWTAANPALTPTWSTDLRINAGRVLRLALVDSAYGQDSTVTPWAAVQREAYRQAEELTPQKPRVESWLMVHRPIFGHITTQYNPGNDPLWVPWISVDQQVASYGLLDNFNAILSSHMHLMQTVQIPGQPGQIVLGNGGTELDPATGYDLPAFGPLANAQGYPLVEGLTPYSKAESSFTAAQFGYAMLTPGRSRGRWTWEHYDPDNHLFAYCSQLGRNISCENVNSPK